MWQALAKSDSLFAAQPLLVRGVAVAALEYQLAPKASMTEIVEQTAQVNNDNDNDNKNNNNIK